MFSKILVPLDGSKVGEAAFPVIEQLVDKLAPKTQVEVVLLGVITLLRHWVVVGEASAPVSYTEEEMELIRKRVTDYLEKTGDAMKKRGVIISTMVRTGNASDEVLKAAGEVGAELIAMSTHGRSGLRRLAFGSITDKVIRDSNVPVLLVRAAEGTTNEPTPPHHA
jgi:nucleotide-binding universal stress UspA family protein